MQRLTHERNNGIKTGYWSPEKKEVLVQRLAEYENTGLEPDQIRKIVMSMPAAFNKEKVIKKLVELKQKEYNDSDEELELSDAEEIYDEGRSQGRFEAYQRAIEIVEKGGKERECRD